ncbi:golgin subfamily A member 5 [Spatholobus suberectus]|nr:golgin subfamily A member 5 [Spatholobus suberectus]
MELPTHRTWMYNRLLPGRKGYTTEFLKGIEEFIDFACRQPKYLSEGVIRCPCKLCKNERYLTPDEVNAHIIKKGFTPKYWYWTSHGEKVPHINDDVEVHLVPSGGKNTSELSAAITMLSLKSKQNTPQACFNDQPQLTQSQPQPQPAPAPPLPPQSHTTQYQHIPTQVLCMEEYPMVSEAPSSSSSHVNGGNNGNTIMILPEGDGFDQHKLVIGTIASIIRTNLEEAKPSWKQLSIGQRDSWFNIFKSKFTWPPQYKDVVRRNFEKRGSAKMSQLMQEVRKNLNQKPTWMEDGVWAQLKAHWESSNFKKKSEVNKRNRESMDGASLHTGGSIPHRLHWKRMKEAKGTDPSLAEFYFRTHRKKDKSWVGPRAESAYDKFEQSKFELSQSSAFTSGEDGAVSQSSIDHMPSDLDIWVASVGKKKGRIFGLGSIGKTLFTSSSQPMKLSANSEEVDVLRNQIQALNESLQRQEQDKLKMRQELNQTKKQGSVGKTFTSSRQPMKLSANSEEVDVLRSQIKALNESLQRQQQEKLEMRQELTQTKKQVEALMQHLGFVGSSSHPSSSPQHSSANDDEDSETISDHIE